MSAASSSEPHADTHTQEFPVTPSADNAFALQPIAQEYLAAARAVATALLYRYTGVNLGYGAPAAAATRVRGKDGSVDAHLAAHPSPLHYAQVVLAEWLLVFSAVAERHTDFGNLTHVNPSCKAFAGLRVINAPSELLLAPDEVFRGTAVPSLSCVLVYVADWLGTVLPAYQSLMHGDVKNTVKPLLSRIKALRVRSMAADTALNVLLHSGEAQTSGAFVHYIGRFFATDRALVAHNCALLVVAACDEEVWVPRAVAASTSGCTNVAVAIDAATFYRSTFTVAVPPSVTIRVDDIDAAMDSRTICVARGGTRRDKWFPLLPFELADAALEYVVIDAATATLVNALPGSATPADHVEVQSKACTLFYAANQGVVINAARTAFLERFPSTCTSISTPTSTVQPTTKIVETADIVVRPGRHVHSGGGTMLSLYYTPETWADLQSDVDIMLGFFKKHEVVRNAAGRSFFATVNVPAHHTIDDDDDAITYTTTHELTRNNSAYVAHAVPISTDVRQTESTQLSQAPFWSLVFMREDLLAIATSGKRDGARKALAALWTHHVPRLAGRRFHDNLTYQLIADTLAATPTCIPGANKWAAGAMVELVFGFWDVDVVLHYVGVLDDFLSTTRVVQHYENKDDEPNATCLSVGFHPNSESKAITAYGRFVCKSDADADTDADDYVLQNVPKGSIDPESILAWSEPPLRGLCITTTQIAILAAFGTAEQQKALQDVARACDLEQINTEALYRVTVHDKDEIQWHGKQRRGGSGSTPATTPSNPRRSPDTTSQVSQATLVAQ
jgi:hypothetical protein